MRPMRYAELLTEIAVRDGSMWLMPARELATADPMRDAPGHPLPIGWWLDGQSFTDRLREASVGPLTAPAGYPSSPVRRAASRLRTPPTPPPIQAARCCARSGRNPTLTRPARTPRGEDRPRRERRGDLPRHRGLSLGRHEPPSECHHAGDEEQANRRKNRTQAVDHALVAAPDLDLAPELLCLLEDSARRGRRHDSSPAHDVGRDALEPKYATSASVSTLTISR